MNLLINFSRQDGPSIGEQLFEMFPLKILRTKQPRVQIITPCSLERNNRELACINLELFPFNALTEKWHKSETTRVWKETRDWLRLISIKRDVLQSDLKRLALLPVWRKQEILWLLFLKWDQVLPSTSNQVTWSVPVNHVNLSKTDSLCKGSKISRLQVFPDCESRDSITCKHKRIATSIHVASRSGEYSPWTPTLLLE